jgi:hypothetical protein
VTKKRTIIPSRKLDGVSTGQDIICSIGSWTVVGSHEVPEKFAEGKNYTTIIMMIMIIFVESGKYDM